MPKGKSQNPADAFRKAQRKKELKKNKAGRAKARDFALVKKDTRELEEEIEKLESTPDGDKGRLKELKVELEKINTKKEEWIAEHPEHKKLVYRPRKSQEDKEKEVDVPKPQSRNLFNKRGLPRHPERSIYYDPVMNPYGVPPPGMPYIERPLRPDEVGSDQEELDDDIVMPAGPPPTALEEVDSDDDIPMPEGPPPPKEGTSQVPPLPPALSTQVPPVPPLPLGVAPIHPMAVLPPPPGYPILPHNIPPPPPLPLSAQLPPPPPPPPPPSGFHPYSPHAGVPGAPPRPFVPPPPPGFGQPQFPPPPPGFFPRRAQTQGSMQDPLSSIPHQTFQAHRAANAASSLPPHPSLPAKPTTGPSSAAISSAAVVSAEPELRDFKKESMAFIPSTLKKKKATASTSTKINAAPNVEAGDESGGAAAAAPRPDLLSTLRNQFGTKAPEPVKPAETEAKKDDYAKFLDEMDDILGSTKGSS